MRPADFRSDTVTRPTAAMREAMAVAEVGDDVLDGDPTVAALEQRGARWLGKEAALFVPSGTMANQVAVGAWVSPGDEIVVQRWAHVTTYEAGAVGALHGVQTLNVGDESGRMDADEVRAAVRPVYIHCPRTALVCTEQTHNVAGGRVAPLAELEAIRDVAREAGIPVHLDGARASPTPSSPRASMPPPGPRRPTPFPCASPRASGHRSAPWSPASAEFIERARVLRKRFGGWMRQAGSIAAGALFALEHHVERLAEDHALARSVARTAQGFEGITVDPEAVDTNIAMCRIERPGFDAYRVAEALAEHGVLALPMKHDLLRFTTHLDVGPADVERLETALRAVLS